MLSKKWRDYKWEIRPLLILAWLVCSPAALLPVMWLASREQVDWPAWVQAIGSVAAILVAVRVADQARTDLQQQRDHEIAQREEADRVIDHAHAVRLDAFLAEINVALRMILDHQGSTKPVLLGTETVDVYRRMMERLQVAFNEDMNITRMKILTKCRFNLSSLLHQLQSCEEKFLDSDCFEFVQDILKTFGKYRDQLGRCSGLFEDYSYITGSPVKKRD